MRKFKMRVDDRYTVIDVDVTDAQIEWGSVELPILRMLKELSVETREQYIAGFNPDKKNRGRIRAFVRARMHKKRMDERLEAREYNRLRLGLVARGFAEPEAPTIKPRGRGHARALDALRTKG